MAGVGSDNQRDQRCFSDPLAPQNKDPDSWQGGLEREHAGRLCSLASPALDLGMLSPPIRGAEEPQGEGSSSTPALPTMG